MKYRFSASSIKVYKSCKFRFYCKSTKQKEDEFVNQTYGDAGTVVHDTLEYYYTHCLGTIDNDHVLKELESYFNSKWDEKDTGNLDRDLYWLCVVNGMKLKLDWTHLEHKFHFTDPVEYVGYADIMNVEENWIGDWKTSTYKKSKVDDYKEQLKYYAYAYRKEFGKNPMCWVYFNKANKIFKFQFDDVVLDNVGIELVKLKRDVERRINTTDWPREPSNKNCFFCPYKDVCKTDLLREKPKKAPVKKEDEAHYVFHFVGNKVKIKTHDQFPLEVIESLEKQINFEVKNSHFIRKAKAAKGQFWDGIKRLFRTKPYGAETFIGYTNLVYKELKKFYDKTKFKLTVKIVDHRSKPIMESEMFKVDKLNVPFEFHPYQNEAADALMKARWGICEVGTGGGKTAIAAECIRRVGTKTLFLIDNKDLLLQTKAEYEEMLGVECGIVGLGKAEWDKPIILATIQTVAKHKTKYQNQLSTINLVIYDETHIIAAKSFEEVSKHLVNTKYRFGFSATAKRDDGNDNIIFAHTGEIVFSRTARWLIDNGYLIEPQVFFYNYDSKRFLPADFQNEYVAAIVKNPERNGLILRLTRQHVAAGRKVMILCKRTEHCKHLLEELSDLRSALIYGKTDEEVRVETMADFRADKLDILIGNIKIFNKGINVKNLDVLINATGNAGEVVTVQSIGRALRKSKGKDTAYYLDFIDQGEYVGKHSISRIDALKKEGYEVEIKHADN